MERLDPARPETWLPLLRFLAGQFAWAALRGLSADDLVQEGATGLLQARRRFQEDQGFAFATLGGIRARGAMADAVHRASWGFIRRDHRPLRLLVDLKGDWPCDDPGYARVEDRCDLARALRLLGGQERWVIEQYYFGGRELDDLGRELGVTGSRVCQVKRRALRRLREAMAA